MSRFQLIVLLYVPFAACGAPDAEQAASQVQEQVKAIRSEAESTTTPQRDPATEKDCAEVTQEQMDRVEEKMKNLRGDLVMLGPDETLALRCSRYQKDLRGESNNY